MSDVFLSYKSEDRNRVEKLAQALIADGFDIWWDTEIPTGTTYREVISGAIASAKAVVVCFSKQTEDSKHARWVFGEVDEAWRQNKHVLPVIIEQCTVPMEYRAVQGVDLSHWNGDRNAPEWLKFTDGVRAALTGEAPPERPLRKKGGAGAAIGLLALLAIAGGAGAFWYFDPLGLKVPPAPSATLYVERATDLNPIVDGLRAADEAFLSESDHAQTYQGALKNGESQTFDLSASSGRVVGLCACDEIGLALRYVSAEAARDISLQDRASASPVIVTFPPDSPESPARVTVTMSDCKQESCDFMLRHYPHPRTGGMGSVEPQSEPVPEGEWKIAVEPDDVREGLVRNAQAIDPKDRTQVFAPVFAKLQVGWNARVTLQLEAGRPYVFTGFCGAGCDDMDLYLESVNGHYADATDLDVNPKLEYTPPWSGEYNLSAQVVACPEGQTCAFALTGYAYPRGPAEAGE